MNLFCFVLIGGQEEPEIDKLLQENDGQQLDFEKGWFAGVDPGFLERGFVCIKIRGDRFADFIS